MVKWLFCGIWALVPHDQNILISLSITTNGTKYMQQGKVQSVCDIMDPVFQGDIRLAVSDKSRLNLKDGTIHCKYAVHIKNQIVEQLLSIVHALVLHNHFSHIKFSTSFALYKAQMHKHPQSSYVLLFLLNRFGKTGTLTVEERNTSQKPIVRMSTSPGTATILDVNQSTLMFIGGLGGQIKV